MGRKRIHLFVVGALVAALAGSSMALADGGGGKKGDGKHKGGGKVSAHLDGYQETPPSTRPAAAASRRPSATARSRTGSTTRT
jgi:hypothetical protein